MISLFIDYNTQHMYTNEIPKKLKTNPWLIIEIIIKWIIYW